MRTLLSVLLALSPGCMSSTVLIDGEKVPRERLDFTGHPYALRHVGVHPAHGGRAGGLSGAGGTISGLVCGVDVVFDVDHAMGHTQLVGTLNNEHGSQLRVEDGGGVRAITGALATQVVDLRVTPSRIAGFVGRYEHDLRWDGEAYSDTWRVGNFNKVEIEHRIVGKDGLWQMPAADQAVLLPLTLACLTSFFVRGPQYTASPEPLRFGGAVGALPRDTIVFRR